MVRDELLKRQTKLFVDGVELRVYGCEVGSIPHYIDWCGEDRCEYEVVNGPTYIAIDGPDPIPESGVHTVRIEFRNGRVFEFKGDVDTFNGRPAFRVL